MSRYPEIGKKTMTVAVVMGREGGSIFDLLFDLLISIDIKLQYDEDQVVKLP